MIDAFNHDPIEDDPDLKPILEAASKEAEAELSARGRERGFGYCHSFWPVKQRILKEKYHVDWKSPGQMNPGVDFD